MLIKGMKAAKKEDIKRKKENSDFLILEDGESAKVRILETLDSFAVVYRHWKDSKPYTCISGEGTCPMCESEDPEVRKTNRVILLNVYNYETKQVKILQGKSDIYKQLDTYASTYKEDLFNRDYNLVAEQKTRGTWRWIEYALIPLDKSPEPKEIKDKITIDWEDYVILPTPEAMEEALSGEDTK